MSEEEKEAIEEAKKQIEEAHNLNDINIFMTDSTTLKILLNYIDKLQKENEKLKEENTILEGNKIGYKLATQELKRCIDAQKIMRKDMPKDTKLILMYSEDYKRIFKEE